MSDATAEFSEGQVKAVCSVNGPLEAKLKDERPQNVSLELVYRPASGVAMIRERLIQDVLHAALVSTIRGDLLPRSLVQVVVQLVEKPIKNFSWVTDSLEDTFFFTEISCSLNAIGLSLLKSGVPCKGVLTGHSFGLLNGEIVEVERGQSMHVVGVVNNKIVVCESLGEFTKNEVAIILKKALQQHSERIEKIRK